MKKLLSAALIMGLFVGGALAEPIVKGYTQPNHLYHYMRDINAAGTDVTLDSAGVDTTVTVQIRPGTRLASSVTLTHSDDVMDFLLVLELAVIEGTMWRRTHTAWRSPSSGTNNATDALRRG